MMVHIAELSVIAPIDLSRREATSGIAGPASPSLRVAGG